MGALIVVNFVCFMGHTKNRGINDFLVIFFSSIEYRSVDPILARYDNQVKIM
jgi:hypothetical protein